MADNVVIRYFMRTPHISQIITGFCSSDFFGIKNVIVENHCNDSEYPYKSAILEVEYKGKLLVYDMLDGYNDIEAISYYLQKCDFYFKRSFSREKNREYFLQHIEKMYPLGFNYHVSCYGHPYDCHVWKETIKRILGKDNDNWCNTSYGLKKFEKKPVYKKNNFKVIFLTRLWETEKCSTEEERKEREYINAMRVEIIKGLQELPGINFVGGITDNDLARKSAPEIIVPTKFTARKRYLKLMKSADICIGSMGLYESIGWKTGEYIAASKAIVNEKMHYEVPGSFTNNENYIEFSSTQECIDAIKYLISNPDKVFEMKKKNYEYYNAFLRPDKLIENSLFAVNLL